MARSKADSQLTLSQIGRIRASQSKKLTGILNRVARYAEGTLTDPQGNPIDMTAGQLKAAEIMKAVCLPQMTASTIEDITSEVKSKDQVEAEYKEAIESVVKGMTQGEIDQIRIEH